MSRHLVIPATALPSDLAFPNERGDDSPQRPETWQEIADHARVDGIENFGSAWCVEFGIDGLGICTEESGQETEAQAATRKDRESAALLQAAEVEKANTARVADLRQRLTDAGITEADILTVAAKIVDGDSVDAAVAAVDVKG